MKRILSMILILFAALSLLTGCVREDLGVVLNEDGTAKLTASVGIEKEAYEQITGMGGDVFEGKETSEYEYDGKTYVTVSEGTEYQSYDELRQALLELEYQTGDAEATLTAGDDEVPEAVSDEENSLETEDESKADDEPADTRIFKDVTVEAQKGLLSKTYVFRAVTNPQTAKEDAEISLPDSFRLTLSVEMPGEITESGGGQVEGNTVTFEINDLTQENELSAASEQFNTTLIIITIAAALIILIGFLLLISRNRKKAV